MSARTGRFYFTITDLARFLGKSPVTLRGWERKGLIDPFPRDEGGDRKLSPDHVIASTTWALEHGRITEARADLIAAAMTLLKIIERENK